jgi:hypothetical protein
MEIPLLDPACSRGSIHTPTKKCTQPEKQFKQRFGAGLAHQKKINIEQGSAVPEAGPPGRQDLARREAG